MLPGLLFCEVHGQQKILLPNDKPEAHITVNEGIISGTYQLTSFEVQDHLEEGDGYFRLSLPGAYASGIPGTPELPVYSVLAEADPDVSYTLFVEHIDSVCLDMDTYFPGKQVVPALPSVQKRGTRTTHSWPADTSGVYLTGQQGPVISIHPQGIMRGTGICQVIFSPFRYDPRENLLTVFHSVEFRLIPRKAPETGFSDSEGPFRKILDGIIRDESHSTLKRLVKDEPVTMVILSDTLFRHALQPLITWKRQKGFNVIEAYTSDPEVGKTNNALRSYMQSLYDHPPEGVAPPSYLLIAGDVEHVPLSQSSGQVTDLYYTTFDGDGDYLPEMFHGRISVKNDTQLMHVVDKILMYEKYALPDPSYLNRTILIAGYDAGYGPLHGNGQIRYAENYYFNQEQGIDAHVYLHPEAASLDHDILVDIGKGAAMVNYTGHGEYYGWLDPAFRLSHIDTLGNLFKYGLMIGNGCSTNQFNLSSIDCFAEAVVKAKDRGAVGYIGCTNDSYWDEDYFWAVGVGSITSDPQYEDTGPGYYDKVFHHGDEPVADWAPSMGEMIYAGNMTVQQSTSDKKKYYWEIYQLMGDPSLVPWFSEPGAPEVVHPGSIPEEATQVSVQASPYDYIALSTGGKLIAARHADRFGQASLQIPDTLGTGNLALVVTGDQRQPYMDTIPRGAGRRGYMELAGYGLARESVRTDNRISTGESFSLDLDIHNTSGRLFHSQELILSCKDSFIEIEDSVVHADYIGAGDTLSLKNAFRITVSGVPGDHTTFSMRIRKSKGDEGNVLYINERVHTPDLISGGITWDDRSHGNGNGILEPDEKVRFKWKVLNRGSYMSDSLVLATGSGPSGVITNPDQVEIPGIPAGEERTLNFTGEVSEAFPGGTGTNFPLYATDGYFVVADSLYLFTAQHFDDFSSGDLSRFEWNTGDEQWFPDSVQSPRGPRAMRSGHIGHNDTTSLWIEFEHATADTLMFDFCVSTEKNYDFLEFYADGTRIRKWSGVSGWDRFSHPLDPGRHILEWMYTKDGNTSNGEDAVWIDNVVFPEHSFDSTDLGLLNLTSPLSSPTLDMADSVTLELVNTGRDMIYSYEVGCRFGSGSWHHFQFDEPLAPGQKKEISLPVGLDMSEVGTYTLVAGVETPGDAYPGNDTVTYKIGHYRYPDLALALNGVDSIPGVRADLLIQVLNQGNIYADEMAYTYRLNGELERDDTLAIDLAPGESGEFAIRILGAENTYAGDGWQQYLIMASPDSVPANNILEGELYWLYLQSIQRSKGEFSIYPNPASESLTLELPGEGEPYRISIHTITGVLIHEETISGGVTVHQVSEIFGGPGVFVIRITDGNGNLCGTGKVIVSSEIPF